MTCFSVAVTVGGFKVVVERACAVARSAVQRSIFSQRKVAVSALAAVPRSAAALHALQF